MQTNKLSHALLTSDLKPTRALKKVLAFFSINPDVPLEQLVAVTQQKWLRKKGTERWHNEQKTSISQELQSAFSDLCIIDEILPDKDSYDYSIVLGSDLEGAQSRLHFLLEMISQGITMNTSIILASDRPLDAHENDGNTFLGSTETEMMKKLVDQMLPENVAPISFIEAKGTLLPDGTFQRATTADTFALWVSHNPKPGSCLIISDQPFIGYQDAVARTYLQNSWRVVTCGPTAKSQLYLEDILDTLARWLYQENQILKKFNN